MKEIKLTQGKFALVDDEDYDWLSQWKWYVRKDKKDNTFYAARNIRKENGIGQRALHLHREIMKTPPGMVCDHVDRNGLNCQKNNLRNCTQSENLRNCKKYKNSTSMYKGVHKRFDSFLRKDGTRREYWTAIIYVNKKRFFLGDFKTEIEAALAWNKAAKKYHGEFANLNIIYCNPCIVNSNNLIQKFNQI